MFASANTHNYGAYARTRAAILCFGGWGLQTMLHLWPRLRLIQEQREVMGSARELPNLDRLTAFAAILPETASDLHALPDAPFQVLQPNPERYPAPFYLERHLAAMTTGSPPQITAGLTHAEWVGARLLQRARDDGYVRPLPVAYRPSADDGAGLWPTTRADVFRAGMAAAGPIARTLLSRVVDPTRLDSMQARDPFVQTTIYVIAPLAEPRASALIWPVVSELVEAFSRRHVSRVIGFFSTASFAPDDSRAIEEAVSYMALRELEALTGVGGQNDHTDSLVQLVGDYGGDVWRERVGKRLFDAIYLVDREKSNQALAESSLDLAVLVGNVIEAFLTADGLNHIEQSLGPETPAGRPSYSVIGAASDHVPLAGYIASAIEEEQKEIIRSAVLAGGQQPSASPADLQALGATPDAFVRRFLDAGPTSFFEPMADRPAPAWPPAVRIAESYLVARAGVDDLRATQDLQHWPELVKRRMAGIVDEIEHVCQAAQSAWGSAADRSDQEDDRFEPTVISKAIHLAAEQIVADMCDAPEGILRARARLASWLDAVAGLLHDLQSAINGDEAGDEAYRARLHAWYLAFADTAADHSQTVALWVRVLVVACLGSLGLAGTLLLQRAFDLGREGRVAMIVGLVAGLALLGVVAWRSTVRRLGQLKRQRIALAQEELSRLATRSLRRGLFRAYAQLAAELAGFQAAIEEALADLTSWARAAAAPARGAAGADDAPTRAALAHEALWTSVRDHIHREDADGVHSLERFRALWRQEGNDAPPWSPDSNRLARRLHAALEARHQAHADVPPLADVFREYAARATEALCPTHRLLADHPDLVREAIEQCRAERLLVADHGQEGTGDADYSSADAVERLYVRAKPAAGFEVTYLLSSHVLEVEFGVSADATTSALRRAFEQRGLPLLSSHDPLTLTLIRTVNRLDPAELVLTERCRDEFARLNPEDQARLSLFPAVEPGPVAALYGEGCLRE